MKTIRKILLAAMLLVAALYPSDTKAQVSLNSYFNVDWQFNIPLGNNFSDGASGWGMNFEGGYYLTQDFSIGAFLNFHTNNEYFPRHTIALSETLSMSSRQQHQMFTLPFGVASLTKTNVPGTEINDVELVRGCCSIAKKVGEELGL